MGILCRCQWFGTALLSMVCIFISFILPAPRGAASEDANSTLNTEDPHNDFMRYLMIVRFNLQTIFFYLVKLLGGMKIVLQFHKNFNPIMAQIV